MKVYAVATTMTKQNGADLNIITGLMVMEAGSDDEARGKHSRIMTTEYPAHQIFAQVADCVRIGQA